MKRLLKVVVLALAVLAGSRAVANPYLLLVPFAVMGAQVGAQYGPPLAAMTGYGVCHTPSIHIFGTERATVGLDWSSFISKSRNVYGIQMGILGGGFSEDLFGVEIGLLSCGWMSGYDTSACRMNGIEIAPFAVKTAMANGFQVCPIYSTAAIVNGFQIGGIYADAGLVNGFQIGLVNGADRVNGIQVGLYNFTRSGYCMQIGLFNFINRRRTPFMPVINLGFR